MPAAGAAQRKGNNMTLADWPEDTHVSPFRLIPWKQALADLDISSNALMRLLADNGIGVVRLTPRKRAVLACDLRKLVQARTRSANTYAAAANAEARHA
jgi:hypothetical protein